MTPYRLPSSLLAFHMGLEKTNAEDAEKCGGSRRKIIFSAILVIFSGPPR